jgi:hypothetical protein
MNYQFLVTTSAAAIPAGLTVVMVDGTVPGWEQKEGDFHFDHHRPGGADIQLQEIPSGIKIQDEAIFVTTMVDADACAAAAWVILLQGRSDPCLMYEAQANLSAIAYDCDHLGLPQASKWDPYRNFAKNAVAAMKEAGGEVVKELGLSSNRKEWTEQDKNKYTSECFKRGTEQLVNAALGGDYPGENGEANAYFEKQELLRQRVYENCRVYRGCGVFDQTGFEGYVDPRLFVEWCREQKLENPITLTIRDGSKKPNAKLIMADDSLKKAYTLGSVPLHSKGSPKYSDKGVWTALDELEKKERDLLGVPYPETKWGGRNEVGGSGWNDPVLTSPNQLLDCVLDV